MALSAVPLPGRASAGAVICRIVNRKNWRIAARFGPLNVGSPNVGTPNSGIPYVGAPNLGARVLPAPSARVPVSEILCTARGDARLLRRVASFGAVIVLSLGMSGSANAAVPALIAGSDIPVTNNVHYIANNTNRRSAGFVAKLDTTSPSSITVLVNKSHPLPKGYVPKDLRTVGSVQMRGEAATQLQKLLDAAKANGTPLRTRSGYRSYATQQGTYASWVGKLGVTNANLYSAKPGYSEHQTGLAIDMIPASGNCQALSRCMAQTPAGKWLDKNAAKYGFILRYEEGKTSITGYAYEAWHYRYIGVARAQEYKAKGYHTLEKYFADIA